MSVNDPRSTQSLKESEMSLSLPVFLSPGNHSIQSSPYPTSAHPIVPLHPLGSSHSPSLVPSNQLASLSTNLTTSYPASPPLMDSHRFLGWREKLGYGFPGSAPPDHSYFQLSFPSTPCTLLTPFSLPQPRWTALCPSVCLLWSSLVPAFPQCAPTMLPLLFHPANSYILQISTEITLLPRDPPQPQRWGTLFLLPAPSVHGMCPSLIFPALGFVDLRPSSPLVCEIHEFRAPVYLNVPSAQYKAWHINDGQ